MKSKADFGFLHKKIYETRLSVRTKNCLVDGAYYVYSVSIDTVEKLIDFSRGELLKIKNLGHKSLKEIEDLLYRHGLELRSGFTRAYFRNLSFEHRLSVLRYKEKVLKAIECFLIDKCMDKTIYDNVIFRGRVIRDILHQIQKTEEEEYDYYEEVKIHEK